MVGGAYNYLEDMFVWSFLIHGTRSQKVPPTDTTLISCMLGPINRMVLWCEHVVQVGISPTNHREPTHLSNRTFTEFLTLNNLRVWCWLLDRSQCATESVEVPTTNSKHGSAMSTWYRSRQAGYHYFWSTNKNATSHMFLNVRFNTLESLVGVPNSGSYFT